VPKPALLCDSVLPIESRSVQVGDIRWHIQTTGSGPLCLLIHGTGASVHSWEKLAQLLAGHYTVVMMDLPAHADTQSPSNADLSLVGMTSAIMQLIEHEQWQIQLMVGHSAGAAIMFEMCLQDPQLAQRLVSINGAVIPLSGVAGYLFSPLARFSANSQWMSHFFSFRARNDRNVKKLLDSTGSSVDAKSFQRYAQLFSTPSHVSGVLRMMAHWRLERLPPRLKHLQQDVELIAASDDKTIPLRDTYKLQQLLPVDKVSVSVLSSGGHLLHEQDPVAVAQRILGKGTT